MESDAVLDLAFPQVAQTGRPLPGMHQIIRHVLGEKNVSGVTTIHHPLRHVDPGPGDVGPPAHVGYLAHRAAVNAHAHRKLRMFLKRFCNLERAAGRFFRAVAKDQRHAVAGRQPNELFVGRVAHLRRPEHDLRELVQSLLLLLVQELRVTDDIDEEDVSDLEAKIVVRFRHRPLLPETDVRERSILGCPASALLSPCGAERRGGAIAPGNLRKSVYCVDLVAPIPMNKKHDFATRVIHAGQSPTRAPARS